MDVNIKTKYVDQCREFKFVDFLDVLNPAGVKNISKLQLVMRKNTVTCFNKTMSLYKDFKIFIDGKEQDIYDLTKNYFPIIGDDAYHVNINMNMEIAGTQENKLKSIEIFTNSEETKEDIGLINSYFVK